MTGSNTTPCNMHTDLTIVSNPDGSVVLTGKSSTGTQSSVQMNSAIATRLGQAAGLAGAPASTGAAPSNMHTDSGSNALPFNMHTDGSTQIVPTTSGTTLTVTGPADAPTGSSVSLELTIDGAALNTLKGDHAGL